jgi:hypothetical protein
MSFGFHFPAFLDEIHLNGEIVFFASFCDHLADSIEFRFVGEFFILEEFFLLFCFLFYDVQVVFLYVCFVVESSCYVLVYFADLLF